MAVSRFLSSESGAVSSSEFTPFTATNANQLYTVTKAFTPGAYRFVVSTAGAYTLVFYSGNLITQTFDGLSSSSIINITSAASIIRYSSNVANGLFSISNEPVPAATATNLSISTISNSTSVTINSPSFVVALGGGGGGLTGGTSGGSGFITRGVLNPGNYSATIGSGAGPGGTGGTTSIGNISAAGGSPNAGGSGPVNYTASNGQIDGAGGSGVKISETLLASGIPYATTPAGLHQGGGVYGSGSGNGNSQNNSGGASGGSANGFGGGGASATNGLNNTSSRIAGSGFQGAIWIGSVI